MDTIARFLFASLKQRRSVYKAAQLYRVCGAVILNTLSVDTAFRAIKESFSNGN
jgi:hypothetical protein